MEYTKGDWKANAFGVQVNDYVIADCYPKQHSPSIKLAEVEANANLIAAAPDMYEALKEILPCINSVSLERPYNLILQALAKAEGMEV